MSLQSILTLYLLLFNLSHGWGGTGLSEMNWKGVIRVNRLWEVIKLNDTWLGQRSTKDVGFALDPLTELAQHVTSKNDMLAILRCPQYDPMAIKLIQKFDMIGWQRFLQALTKSVLVQDLPLGNLHYNFALVQSASVGTKQFLLLLLARYLARSPYDIWLFHLEIRGTSTLAEEMETAGFGLYWADSGRQISDKGDLSAYWREISSEGDFLGPSNTPPLNVPYLLSKYLSLFASRRKHGAMISGGQFVAHLAEHFGLFTKERLHGLTISMRSSLMICALRPLWMLLLVDEGAHSVSEEVVHDLQQSKCGDYVVIVTDRSLFHSTYLDILMGAKGLLASVYGHIFGGVLIFDKSFCFCSCEFADVFRCNFWTSSDREIEFGIELISGAEPFKGSVSVMAPVELKELKDCCTARFYRRAYERHLTDCVRRLLDRRSCNAEGFSSCEFLVISKSLSLGNCYLHVGHHYGSSKVEVSPNGRVYYVTELMRKGEKFVVGRHIFMSGLGAVLRGIEKEIGMCSKNDQALREKVMTEAHSSPFTIHPGSTKMYEDLNSTFGLDTGVYEEDVASLKKAWGTRLKFSTAFHPQTDGQSERTIQTLEDMLRDCALEWTGSWDEYLCLVEFAYNNSWQASIKAAPFELLYGRKCRVPICWDEVGERLIEGPELIEITNEKVVVAKEKLKEARSRQNSYADKHRRDLEFQVGDRVFLKVSPFRGVKRFGIKGKLSP
ncbi:putative nucleotidyltransferase, ribonuclease H [Tanacetum coccineum]